ncbi:hypothetical protein CDAR_575191 [Caerostris darwini]|uniref:Uncharacterized protein n=1 Tax=Caerostris darwini TaxID=1538125 RepID=A0AAV4MWC8_9ARAC|nr:hypothetical protein CDAR_575191 [Caerostris darwini]
MIVGVTIVTNNSLTIGYERLRSCLCFCLSLSSFFENISNIKKGKEYELKIHIRYSVSDCHCIHLQKMFLNYFE